MHIGQHPLSDSMFGYPVLVELYWCIIAQCLMSPHLFVVWMGMCNWAHSAVFPFATILWFKGMFPWVKDEDADTHEERVACPDGTNPDFKAKVIFALRRERLEESQ